MTFKHADSKKEDTRRFPKKSRAGMTPCGFIKRLPVFQFRRCLPNRRTAQRLREQRKKSSAGRCLWCMASAILKRCIVPRVLILS
jgi:hypothetical protein